MMKSFVTLFLGLCLVTGVVQAEQGDPMESLFKFQQKMAANGSTAAMMKLGELYEEGQGTKQDFDKAIEMYKKAGLNGDARAEAALKRVKKRKMAASSGAGKARKARLEKEQARKRAAAQEKARKQEQARQKAARDKQAREKAARDKTQRAAQDKKRKDEATRKRAATERARQAELEKKRRATEQRRKQENKARVAKARKDAIAKAKAREAAKTDKSEKKGFKSNPCRGAASRVMSICKGK